MFTKEQLQYSSKKNLEIKQSRRSTLLKRRPTCKNNMCVHKAQNYQAQYTMVLYIYWQRKLIRLLFTSLLYLY